MINILLWVIMGLFVVKFFLQIPPIKPRVEQRFGQRRVRITQEIAWYVLMVAALILFTLQIKE